MSCRYSLDKDDPGGDDGEQACAINTNSATCVEAEAGQHADLEFIEKSIFMPGCAFTSCHNGGNTAAGKIDLRPGQSHAHLVNFTSAIDPTRKLVVPNDVNASYLMLMLRDFPPQEASPPGQDPPERAGYMPMGNATLCCQKLDAIERWILAGAPTN
ncbi:MAG: hypothetical protein H7138_27340 [Myxococcales bacterium]|nr:hypothetical protein [Myxococcales bacterium]